MQRAVRFVNEANADGLVAVKNEAGCESVGAQVQMRNGIGSGEQGAADFAAGGVAVGVENPRTAVRCFASERKLCSGAVEFCAPFDELRNVFWAFFHEQRPRFGPAKAVSGVDGVLLVQADFVFVAERYGDAALRPGRGGVA